MTLLLMLKRFWWAPVIGLLCLWAGLERDGRKDAELALSEQRAEWANKEADYQAQARQASEAARAAEQRHAEQIAQIDATHQQELDNADDTYRRELGALRDGTLRLRHQLDAKTCPDLVPDTPAGAGEPDARAIIRGSDAANLVRIAERCDARVRGLQAIVVEDRKATAE